MTPKVNRLSMDNWSDATSDHITSDDIVIQPTSEDDVAQVIKRLDQDKHTEVSLDTDSGAVMLVGGGKGDYVVITSPDQGETWNTLQMGPMNGPKKLVTVGGQPGDYESDIVVTLEHALAAARYFFLHGTKDPALTWRPD